MKQQKNQDGGYAWVVLAASFMTLLLNPSMNYAVGVLHVALLETYQDDVTVTAWLGSLFSCMFALSGPVASVVVNCFDCRTCVVFAGVLGLVGFTASAFIYDLKLLFLTYALLAGLGEGFAQTGSLVVLGYYFPNKSTLTAGITLCGAALGMFIHPPLIQFLVDTYGLHGTFLLLAAIVFQSCTFGMLMRPSKFEKIRRKRLLPGRNVTQRIFYLMCGDCFQCGYLIQNISFLFFLLSVVTLAMGISVQYLYIPDFFQKHGASPQHSSFSIAISGVGSLISRILAGLASSDPQIGNNLLYPTIIGILGFLTLFIPVFMSSTSAMFSYGFLLGLYSGGTWIMLSPVTLDILGMEKLATGYGMVMFSCGVGYMIGPPTAGTIYETSGDYYTVFLFSAAMAFTTTVCGFLSTLTRKPVPKFDDITEDISTAVTESKAKNINMANSAENEILVAVDMHVLPDGIQDQQLKKTVSSGVQDLEVESLLPNDTQDHGLEKQM